MRRLSCVVALGITVLCGACVPPASRPAPSVPPVSTSAVTPTSTVVTTETFAVIGDYGTNDEHEAAVARLVASWRPAFIVAAGDDYYAGAGGTGTGQYGQSTGRYFAPWLEKATPPTKNAFFPALGNHDYSDPKPAPETYLGYFDLPGKGFRNTSGNERYYDFVEGAVHFFVLDSNPEEPDGTNAASKQAMWLRAQLAASKSRWNVVVDHHPPYSSGKVHGSTDYMQWPFAEWGADVVISGHDHEYERIDRDGIVYFVNGLGGAARYSFATPVQGSAARFASDWGAQKVTATEAGLDFAFYDVTGKPIDEYRVAVR